VGLLNKGGIASGGIDNCEWATYTGGYNQSCGGAAGNAGCMRGDLETIKAACCGLGKDCVSISAPNSPGGSEESCLKKNDDCGWEKSTAYHSVVKTKQGAQPSAPKGITITADFKTVGWSGEENGIFF
jgi:hypothetical protein